MPIVFGYPKRIKQYQAEYEYLEVSRPGTCTNCGAVGQMIGHGSYGRKVRDWERAYQIRIRRWKCKACKRTISALPDVVMRYRWYVTGSIQEVLWQRYEEQQNWAGLRELTGEAPHVRTMQRWCCGFEQRVDVWLAWMARVLVEQERGSAWLEEGGGERDGERLLSGALHLLGWAKGRWRELGEYGLADWLRFLWLWGWQQGLGRPV